MEEDVIELVAIVSGIAELLMDATDSESSPLYRLRQNAVELLRRCDTLRGLYRRI